MIKRNIEKKLLAWKNREVEVFSLIFRGEKITLWDTHFPESFER